MPTSVAVPYRVSAQAADPEKLDNHSSYRRRRASNSAAQSHSALGNKLTHTSANSPRRRAKDANAEPRALTIPQRCRSTTLSLPPLLVSARESRRLLSVGVTKFYQLVNDLELDTVLVGCRRHVVYDSIVSYVDRLKRGDA